MPNDDETAGRAAPVLEQVASFLRCDELASQPGVVAVSGGPDSVALLCAFAKLGGAGAKPLTVAHLNHRLRGPESNADETFVRQLHARLQTKTAPMLLGLGCETIDVAAEARARGENLESTARRIRYAWLIEVARAAGARWVATGHTADDQAETVLHHLLRGSGLRGLCGIPYRRELAAGIDLVRPLLRLRKESVLAFLEVEGQDYRHDSSNLDLRFTRNRMRAELLPRLAEYNSAVVEHLCQLAEQAADVQAYVESEARALLVHAELPRAGDLVILQRARLTKSPRHLVREVFRVVWQRENWPMAELDYDAWNRMAAVVLDDLKAVDLPGGMRVERNGRIIQCGIRLG